MYPVTALPCTAMHTSDSPQFFLKRHTYQVPDECGVLIE